MSVVCPFCDSENVEKIEIEDTYPVPFCSDVTISHKTFSCHDCEEDGDFDNSLDKQLLAALGKARRDSAPELMEALRSAGITMTYFEKALGLPFRTTARWKQGKISQPALALLQLIRFSPGLLEVADENFSERAQIKYNIAQPLNFFGKYCANTAHSWVADEETVGVTFQGTIGLSPPVKMSSPSHHQVSWDVEK